MPLLRTCIGCSRLIPVHWCPEKLTEKPIVCIGIALERSYRYISLQMFLLFFWLSIITYKSLNITLLALLHWDIVRILSYKGNTQTGHETKHSKQFIQKSFFWFYVTPLLRTLNINAMLTSLTSIPLEFWIMRSRNLEV